MHCIVCPDKQSESGMRTVPSTIAEKSHCLKNPETSMSIYVNRCILGRRVLRRGAQLCEAFLVNETSENVWYDEFSIQSTGPIVVQETHGACPESEASRESLGRGIAGLGLLGAGN